MLLLLVLLQQLLQFNQALQSTCRHCCCYANTV
jgi:hypothetical protein